MAELLNHSLSSVEPCPYLAGRGMVMESKFMLNVSPTELERMLERGWRRFGTLYFRPACASCQACISLRVVVDRFRATKSQRRAWNRCRDLRVEIDRPRIDARRLALHAAWHEMQRRKRDWNESAMDAENYSFHFCLDHPSIREFSYYDGDRLVAIGIVDVTPKALSSVYFFFDPDCARRSLGVFGVLTEIEHARRHRKRHVYLGYRVADCPSLAYKGRFRPHEILTGRPGSDSAPRWQLAP